jgi:hypothetical protein
LLRRGWEAGGEGSVEWGSEKKALLLRPDWRARREGERLREGIRREERMRLLLIWAVDRKLGRRKDMVRWGWVDGWKAVVVEREAGSRARRRHSFPPLLHRTGFQDRDGESVIVYKGMSIACLEYNHDLLLSLCIGRS